MKNTIKVFTFERKMSLRSGVVLARGAKSRGTWWAWFRIILHRRWAEPRRTAVRVSGQDLGFNHFRNGTFVSSFFYVFIIYIYSLALWCEWCWANLHFVSNIQHDFGFSFSSTSGKTIKMALSLRQGSMYVLWITSTIKWFLKGFPRFCVSSILGNAFSKQWYFLRELLVCQFELYVAETHFIHTLS